MGSDIINYIKGLVERITYKNAESGFYVIKIRVKGSKDLITSTGYLCGINVGSVVTLYGEWKNDKNYGRQFSVKNYDENLPATLYGIEKYLGSGLIKGIGPSYAKKIVAHFKEHTLDVIENYPEKLSEIEGIGSKVITKVKMSWEEHKFIKELAKFLQDLDISTYYTTRIYKEYGNDSIRKIKENPYCLSDDIYGLGFKTSDSAARKFDKDTESYLRCRSGIIHILNMEANKGHCYLNFFDLAAKASKKLGIDEGKIIITEDDMIFKKELIGDKKDIKDNENNIKTRVYLPEFYYSEKGIAKLIKIIMNTKEKKKIIYKDTNSNIEYDEIQKKSIKFAINTKFMILTGGPGTGKTTTIKGIIDCLKQNGIKIILTAPTGRAAKRMTETTGLEAKTIHRLLGYKYPSGCTKNENNKLVGDVIIIDESSMIDIFLMYNLLKAIPLEMKVIMVGDCDQLPSVGSGNVLNDIIRSNIVPVIKLKKVYRQAGKSDIIKNAHKINKGEYPEFKKNNTDFFFIDENDTDKVAEIIKGLCSKRLPKYYKVDCIRDIQVLCPMQKGKTGVINMNNILQDVLNRSQISLYYRGIQYKLNDKVMQIRNNYDKEVFNGDIGLIKYVNIKEKALNVNFDGRNVIYKENELEELTLAYATTIHKSQGSEYPIVVMPITLEHRVMLYRNLLYTGITRAKNAIVIVGNRQAVNYAVDNINSEIRNTYLCERLMKG